MDKQSIIQYKTSFDAIASYIEGESEKIEVWFARDLMSQLGYSKWENFQTAIGRAIDSCRTQGSDAEDYFRSVRRTI